jgi:glucosamine--fructose-6-phosphate aminotransferase (isomerizing)
MALGMLASAMGADSLTPDALGLVPESVRDAIAASGTEEIPLPQRSVQLIGAGQGAITAREGALKIREAARMLAEGHDVEFFLHGSAVPIGGQDQIVALTHGDDDGLVRAVATAATSEGIGVSLVDEPASLPPLLAQIPMTVRLQLLAARFAAEREQNPDVVITGKWGDPGLWSIGAPAPY